MSKQIFHLTPKHYAGRAEESRKCSVILCRNVFAIWGIKLLFLFLRNESYILMVFILCFFAVLEPAMSSQTSYRRKVKGQSHNHTSNTHWSQLWDQFLCSDSHWFILKSFLQLSWTVSTAIDRISRVWSSQQGFSNPPLRSMRIWTVWDVNHCAQRPVLMSKML